MTRICADDYGPDRIVCDALLPDKKRCDQTQLAGNSSFDEREAALRNSGWLISADGKSHACHNRRKTPPIGVDLQRSTLLLELRASDEHGVGERATFERSIDSPDATGAYGMQPKLGVEVRYESDGACAIVPFNDIVVIG